MKRFAFSIASAFEKATVQQEAKQPLSFLVFKNHEVDFEIGMSNYILITINIFIYNRKVVCGFNEDIKKSSGEIPIPDQNLEIAIRTTF